MIEHMERPWGYWGTNLHFPGKAKVKTLVVKPGQQLSIQKHQYRNETWYRIEGNGQVYLEGNWYTLYDITHINHGVWHSLKNTGDVDLVILEVQWGGICDEKDIERREN